MELTLRPLITTTAVVAFSFLSLEAYARPAVQTASDTNDDATATLTVLDEAIVPDSKSFCSVDVVIEGTDVAFSSGDTYTIQILEDDTVGNDQLWSMNLTVTSSEVSANRVERTFDCSSDFGSDVGGNLEIFARLDVEKDGCGTFCIQDTAKTPAAQVVEVADDNAEDDDDSSSANGATLGLTTDRIADDQDWLEFTLAAPSDVDIRVEHRPGVGRLEATLFDSTSSSVATSTDAADASVIDESSLPAGTYFVRIQPRSSSDPNFYDFSFGVTAQNTACTPGDTESRDCGNCGAETRTCDNTGSWGDFGDCMGEGPCAPGASESQSCDTTGTETRTCAVTCTWEPFGDCMGGGGCADGDTNSCYGGPAGTDGVGACQSGMQTCSEGSFGACMGEVRPATEICDDGVDNDCDGDQDADDADCAAAGSSVGDACTDDDACGSLTCLRPPAQARFFDGYCSETGCTVGSTCAGDGVCAAAGSEAWCLAICNANTDCQPGYRCVAVPGGDQVCFPGCSSDEHCLLDGLEVCDTAQGTCVASDGTGGGGGDADMGTGGPGGPGGGGGEVDAGTDDAAAGGSEASCAQAGGPSGTTGNALLLFLALGLARLKRRN